MIFGLLPAAAAQATDRYVSPGGSATGTCTAPPGCDIEYAVGTAAGPGDHVIVAPGTYTPGNPISVTAVGLQLLGPGPAQATLNTAAFWGVIIQAANVTVSGLRINHTGSANGLIFNSAAVDSVGERLSVSTTATGSSACRFDVDGVATLRDSVCRYTGASGFGGIATANGSGQAINLRNVTAQATQTGVFGLSAQTTSGENLTVDVRNSIISGTAGAADVFAQDPGGGGSVTVDLDHSDYDGTSPGTNTTITAPGTLNNITASPAFTDTDLTLHQAAGSPTIDKGSATFATTSLDIDGGARIFNGIPDIGADEFVPAPPVTPVAPGSTAAAATGQRAAALAKCKKKKGKARKKCKKKALKLPV